MHSDLFTRCAVLRLQTRPGVRFSMGHVCQGTYYWGLTLTLFSWLYASLLASNANNTGMDSDNSDQTSEYVHLWHRTSRPDNPYFGSCQHSVQPFRPARPHLQGLLFPRKQRKICNIQDHWFYFESRGLEPLELPSNTSFSSTLQCLNNLIEIIIYLPGTCRTCSVHWTFQVPSLLRHTRP